MTPKLVPRTVRNRFYGPMCLFAMASPVKRHFSEAYEHIVFHLCHYVLLADFVSAEKVTAEQYLQNMSVLSPVAVIIR